MNLDLKGLEPLTRAVAMAQRQMPARKISLLVVGKGDSQKFRHLAQEMGIGGQVFFGGVRRDMERIYQAADVFCLLSQFDTFGMVVLEAMAAGVPVIVSDRVGARDLVEHGRNGFVVEREDVDTIAGYLALLTTPEKHQKCSEAVIGIASGHSWGKVAEQYAELYRALAG
jgi:UDP-glucose:(heptosyl)LPS alpha-1,3-glucosyltransferase